MAVFRTTVLILGFSTSWVIVFNFICLYAMFKEKALMEYQVVPRDDCRIAVIRLV